MPIPSDPDRPRGTWLPKAKLMFRFVHKVASSSLKKAIISDRSHSYESVIPSDIIRLRSQHPEFFSIGFCRHPLDRLVSCWHHRVVGGSTGVTETLKINAGSDFRTFAEAVARTPDDEADPHYKSQSWHLYGADPMYLDQILKMEDLPTAWSYVRTLCEDRGHRVSELGHINKTDRRPWPEYYTDGLLTKLRARYADDFRLLGYA